MGEMGEICIRSAVVFLGYWDNPEATAAAFWPGRWYRTGDFGRIDDGVLFVESRMRDMILRGGENIYPIEIEHRLVEHPDIADAGRHRRRPPRARSGGEGVRRARRRRGVDRVGDPGVGRQALAAHKVPAYVEFRDGLPYTATGKVMKTALESEEQT